MQHAANPGSHLRKHGRVTAKLNVMASASLNHHVWPDAAELNRHLQERHAQSNSAEAKHRKACDTHNCWLNAQEDNSEGPSTLRPTTSTSHAILPEAVHKEPEDGTAQPPEHEVAKADPLGSSELATDASGSESRGKISSVMDPPEAAEEAASRHMEPSEPAEDTASRDIEPSEPTDHEEPIEQEPKRDAAGEVASVPSESTERLDQSTPEHHADEVFAGVLAGATQRDEAAARNAAEGGLWGWIMGVAHDEEAASQDDKETAAQHVKEAATQHVKENATQHVKEAATQHGKEAAAQRDEEAATLRDEEAAAQVSDAPGTGEVSIWKFAMAIVATAAVLYKRPPPLWKVLVCCICLVTVPFLLRTFSAVDRYLRGV